MDKSKLRLLIERGWITGNIRLKWDGEIMCSIGEYSFSFDDDHRFSYGSVDNYLACAGTERVLHLIEETLNDFAEDEDFKTEHDYYVAYLTEKFEETAIVNEFMDYLRRMFDLDPFHQRTIENLLYSVPQYVHDTKQQKLMLMEVIDIGLSNAEWEGYFGCELD